MPEPSQSGPDPRTGGRGRALFADWDPAMRMGCIALLVLLLGVAVVLAYLFPFWRP
jgi:hypothetical protein